MGVVVGVVVGVVAVEVAVVVALVALVAVVVRHQTLDMLTRSFFILMSFQCVAALYAPYLSQDL